MASNGQDLKQGPRLPPSGKASFRFGIPSQPFLDFHSFGAASQARAALYSEAWERSVDALKAIGGTCVEVDYAPFQEAANLLYQGPWVAERLSSVADWASDPEVVHPIVRKIAEHGTEWSAQQCFEAIYRLQQLRIEAQEAMSSTQAEVLVTPTVGATYTIEDVLADPVALNTQLGRYTNHMNLLDLCGIAVPTVLSSDAPCLPFGVTISAAAGHDAFICDIAQRLHAASKLTVGALQSSVQDVSAAVEDCPETTRNDATQGKHFGALPADVETFEVAVCGAHMEGLPLSWQLTERGGRFVRRARTAPRYRLVAFDMKPPRPGLVDSSSGASIELEIWEPSSAELPAAAFGSFMKLVASPLGIGWIELEDGSRVQGFRQVDVGANSTGLDYLITLQRASHSQTRQWLKVMTSLASRFARFAGFWALSWSLCSAQQTVDCEADPENMYCCSLQPMAPCLLEGFGGRSNYPT
eukprot:g2574.t1